MLLEVRLVELATLFREPVCSDLSKSNLLQLMLMDDDQERELAAQLKVSATA